MKKDVLLLISEQTFNVKYQTEKARSILSLFDIDNINIPIISLNEFKDMLNNNDLTFLSIMI